MSTNLPVIDALGTVWFIEIFSSIDEPQTDVLREDISLFLADFEAKYSRFKPDSIISTINRTKTLNDPDPETIELLEFGRNMFSETNGVFNLLVGEVMLHRGYDPEYSFKPKLSLEPEVPSPLEALLISPEKVTLSAGQIDLGGYGKGYAIDLVAKRLHAKHGLEFFLINGGGDIYATSDRGQPVTIYLEHPVQPDTYIKETTLFNQGFASSSTFKRRWKSDQRTYTHIVETKTAHSTASRIEGTTIANNKKLGVYVKAPTATLADVWSTTFLIRPETKTPPTIAKSIFDTDKNTLTNSPNF